MSYFELLENRASCRKYTDEMPADELVEQVLLAGNMAPIGSNRTEDVHLTVVRDRAVLDGLAQAMNRRMKDRADLKAITEKIPDEQARGSIEQNADTPAAPDRPAFDPFYGAPVVIFVSHRKQDLQPGIEFSNAAIVAYSMHLAATELGLGSVLMWGSLEAMRMYPEYDNTGLLELPEGFEPLIGLAIGYAAAERPAKQPDAHRLTRNSL